MKKTNKNSKTAPCSSDDDEIDSSDRFNAYTQHSAVLRTWLVAYGVGAPALFLSQDKIWAALSKSGHLNNIAILFLAGVFIQVFLSALNKSVMWSCYYGDITPTYKTSKLCKAANWLSTQYWIDFLCDIASIILFCLATYFTVTVLASRVVI